MRGNRRDIFGLGLAVGLLALTRDGGAAPRRSSRARDVQRDYPLAFRLDAGYRPRLSARTGRRLAQAVLAFIEESHPEGMTLSLWELNPRDMPYLGDHLEHVVAEVFEGIRANLDTWPVDPILVLALLYNESRFKPTVISPAGAVGMAQLMPDTALELGLTPVGRPDLWERFREVRRQEREARAQRIEAFRARHGIAQFSADAVIERAIAAGAVDVLREYVEISRPATDVETARQAYIAALAAGFATHDFFTANGAEALGRLDARTSYAAVRQAVTYVAQRLRQTEGMASSAVAAYNAGPDAVRVGNPRSVLYRYGDIPAYGETVTYVQRLMAVYSEIKLRVR
jgi:hypothetical protein